MVLPDDARTPRDAALFALLALWLVPACASVPYEFGSGLETDRTLPLLFGETQVERGSPHAVLDGVGHYVLSLPTKLLLFSWKVDNHDISEDTEAALREYLEANDLARVKVRLNQYDPGDEWRRLLDNQEVGLLWRYTVGALTVAAYTFLPQRLFGGDNFNPFTNSIHIYSDDRAIALHEAGHAKDFAGARWKGSYAALRLLPLVPLVQEARATSDALGYERVRGTSQDEKHGYRTLYPAYGTYVGGEAVRWVAGPIWLPYAFTYAAALPGHLVGWIRSAFVEERSQPQIPEGPSATAPLPSGPEENPLGAEDDATLP